MRPATIRQACINRRTPAWLAAPALLLLALAVLPWRRCEGQPAHGPPRHQRPTFHMLPTCAHTLGKLPDASYLAMRDVVQVITQGTRRSVSVQKLLNFHRTPDHEPFNGHPKDWEGFGTLFAFNMSFLQLEEHHVELERSLATANDKLRTMIKESQAAGHIADDADERAVKMCLSGRSNERLYEYRPRISLLMQWWQRPQNAPAFIQHVMECNSTELPLELLVNVDHPQDRDAWASAAWDTRGLVTPVFSYNLHEPRGYNRLASLARGQLLVLMADDSLPPAPAVDARTGRETPCGWLHDIARVFERFPSAGVLGLRHQLLCALIDHLVDESVQQSLFYDAALGLDVAFVSKVDMAPMAVRKAAWADVGGFDESLSEPHECGILSDWDMSTRMWLSDWQVLRSKAVPMQYDGSPGNSHNPLSEYRCWVHQQDVTGAGMLSRWSRDVDLDICNATRYLNTLHFELPKGARCPYTNGCGRPT
uniref:Glycosyl transferase CAP10 domain-containing protein n=1 Tax=Chlamydomonas euryale TaxID=1486919 RepID=A0A7R9VV70_9CHLO|mmetsp:Transcript_5138/g.15604  ORF Transcript_5138/g.15604 Transcript_5138/m.15604 type:complete len:480 (+) Transcript_5138:411-1850(+)